MTNLKDIIQSQTDVLSMAREAGLNIPDTRNDLWMPQLERFAALVSKQERGLGFNQGYKQAIKDCVVLLMIQHEMANGAHNYWHVAANLIQAEYGVQHDD